MNYFASNLPLLRFPSRGFGTLRFVYRSLCFLFFASLLGGQASADSPSAPVASFAPRLSFSIADLDGDSKPDLAIVINETSDSAQTNYQIQLQLSAIGQQSFQIAAPTGGLRIVSRDVNSDQALDLVVTSAWLGQPVAILLNDGRGNFSRVDPHVFPEAFSESKTIWESPTEYAVDLPCVPVQPRENIYSEAELWLHLLCQTRFAASSDSRYGLGTFLISHLGRAPPCRFSLS